jgi:glycosyltransferase involved in cell wall biosynthesis
VRPVPAPARGSAASRPVRVTHVISGLPTGGAERQLAWLVGRSAATSDTIALHGLGIVGEQMLAAGHRVEVLGMAGRDRLTALPRLVAALRRRRPDVVHVHLLAAQLWGIPAARLAGVPFVVSSEHSIMEGTLENRPLTPALRITYRALERMATRTVAVSATTRDRLVGLGVAARRITVIDNGIDLASVAFSPTGRGLVRDELGIREGAVVIGAVGRLERVKRPMALLAALAPTLHTEDRHLVLVGDGPLRAALEARAAALGVADRVHLTGPRADVALLLSAMDVLVSCSRDETFGMAVVEALANGLPVVHAQCPALEELDEPVPGAFALPAPVDDAAEAVALRAAVAQAVAIGRTSAAAVVLEQHYGIERTAQAVDRLYQDLVR